MIRHDAMILILAVTALATGCGKAAVEGAGSGTATSTDEFNGEGTGTDATASTTSSSTVTVASTSTLTLTETRLETVTRVETATQVVTATQATTVTETHSLTGTRTVSSTHTVTATSTSASLVQGTYHSKTCYLDKLASDLSGQSVYLKTSFHFSGGTGHKKLSRYTDRDCKKAVEKANLGLSYSYAGSRGGLVVFRIDQDFEQKAGSAKQRYWLVAIESGGDLHFALDGEHGESAYLSEPGEAELRRAAEAIVRNGVWFRKGN